MTIDIMNMVTNIEEIQSRVNYATRYLERATELFGSEFINPKTAEVYKSGENLEFFINNAPEFEAPNLFTDDMTGITYFEGKELTGSSKIAIQRVAETYSYKLTLAEAGAVIEVLQGKNITNVWIDKLKEIGKKWDQIERLNGLGVKYYNTNADLYNRIVFKFWLNGVIHNLSKPENTAPFPFSLDIISEAQGIGKTTFFSNINKVLTGKSFPTNISFNTEDKFALGRIAVSPLVIDDEFLATNAISSGYRVKDPNASIKQFITLENVKLERKGKEAISTQRRYTVGRTTNDKAVYTDLTTGYERRYLPVQPNLNLFEIKLPVDDKDGFYTQLVAEAVVKFNDFTGYGLSDQDIKQLNNYQLPNSIALTIQNEQEENKLHDITTEHVIEILTGLYFASDIYAAAPGSSAIIKRIQGAYDNPNTGYKYTLLDMPIIHVSPISEFIASNWNSAGTPQAVSRKVKKVLKNNGFKETTKGCYKDDKPTRVLFNANNKIEAPEDGKGRSIFEQL